MAAIDLSRDIDRLKNEMDELRKDVSKFSRSARDFGAAKGHDALGRAEEIGDLARKQMARAEKRVSRSVEDRPLASMLVALGIGFLLAKMLGSPRRLRH